jgi:hypothetical protein
VREDSKVNARILLHSTASRDLKPVTLPGGAGIAETKASGAISIGKKTELMLLEKQSLNFLLNLLLAYVSHLSQPG